jgi:hypothetical protein
MPRSSKAKSQLHWMLQKQDKAKQNPQFLRRWQMRLATMRLAKPFIDQARKNV